MLVLKQHFVAACASLALHAVRSLNESERRSISNHRAGNCLDGTGTTNHTALYNLLHGRDYSSFMAHLEKLVDYMVQSAIYLTIYGKLGVCIFVFSYVFLQNLTCGKKGCIDIQDVNHFLTAVVLLFFFHSVHL